MKRIFGIIGLVMLVLLLGACLDGLREAGVSLLPEIGVSGD